jgi:hypothetical protein
MIAKRMAADVQFIHCTVWKTDREPPASTAGGKGAVHWNLHRRTPVFTPPHSALLDVICPTSLHTSPAFTPAFTPPPTFTPHLWSFSRDERHAFTSLVYMHLGRNEGLSTRRCCRKLVLLRDGEQAAERGDEHVRRAVHAPEDKLLSFERDNCGTSTSGHARCGHGTWRGYGTWCEHATWCEHHCTLWTRSSCSRIGRWRQREQPRRMHTGTTVAAHCTGVAETRPCGR